jgi:PAS domain S-box-containing protein
MNLTPEQRDEQGVQAELQTNPDQEGAPDVSPERLRRFFSLDHGMFRVRPDLRDMVLFAVHDLLGDAPFSRMDLLSCRNLLIYFGSQAQEKALGVFHFSLNPDAMLFLGGSETPSASGLFAPLEPKHRLYSRRSLPRAAVPIPVFSAPLPVQPNLREVLGAVALPQLPPNPSLAPTPASTSFGELHLQLLELMAPPSVLVNAEYDILHLSPDTGKFLAFAGGSATTNLLDVAQPSLRLELRAALFGALQSGEEVLARGLRARIEGETRLVDVRVRPLREPGRPDGQVNYLLVVFEERADEAAPAIAEPRERDDVAHRLNLELNQMKAVLRQTVEQYEAATEELKASNEELQAVNEELRLAGEELETSREELQAGNEELQTVNGELKSKVEQLSQSNGDLNNLISSTDIATVFLDRDLCVKRYTPRALELFSLEPTDLGRPLSDLRNRLDIQNEAFIEDAERVLDQLATIEREIETRDGRFYLLRVSPYRTQDNRIDGVILAFVDISRRRTAEVALGLSEERYRSLFTTIEEAFALCEIVTDENGSPVDYRMLEVNPAFETATGISPEAAKNKTARELVPGLEDWWIETYGRVALGGEAVRFENRFAELDRWFEAFASPVGERGNGQFALIFTDISPRKKQEEELLRLSGQIEQQARVFNTTLTSISDFAYIFDRAGRFTYSNQPLLDLLGVSLEEIIGKNFFELGFPPELAARHQGEIERVFASGKTVRAESSFVSPGGAEGFYEYIFNPVFASGGGVEAVAGSTRDISARRRREAGIALLAGISGELSRLSSAADIMKTVGAGIGEYFALSVCAFTDVDEARGEATITHNWHREDVRSLAGTYRIEDFLSRDSARLSRAGEVCVVSDVVLDERTDAARYHALDVGAFVSFPIVRGGKWLFLLVMFDSKAHQWREDEIELMREITARIWTSLERSRTDAALLESHTRARIAVDAAEMGTWQWDLVTNQTFWNERHFLLFGMEPHDGPLDPADFFDHVHPDDREQVRQDLEGAIVQDGIFDTEFRAVLESGEIRWMNGYGRVIEMGDDGRATRMSGVMLDVTHRKEAEELLRQSEERARALFANLPGGAAFIVGRDERYLLAEGEALEAAGFASSDFIGKTIDEVMSLELAQQHAVLYRLALQGESFETEHFERGHWFLTRGVPLRDGDAVVEVLAVSYDITERRQIEEALREREERLRLVMDSVKEYAIMTLDADGLITSWNSGAQKAFGWTDEEVLGQHSSLVFTPEDRQASAPIEEMRVARDEGRAVDDRWHLRKDGGRLFMSGVLAPLRDGGLDGFVKIARDLTREREADAALRESEGRFRTLSDVVPQIIWTNEASGKANYFNSRWFEYSGLTLEESFGPGWQAMIHPGDAPASKESWQRALERGEVFDTEYRLRRFDGVYRWFIGRNVPLRDSENNVSGWFGTATDINDLKEAEANLRENGERFRAMFEQSTAGVVEYDLDGNHIFVNETFCAIVGYNADELLRLGSKDLVHADDWPDCLSCFEQAKAQEGSVTMEKRLIRKTGEVIWVRDSVAAIRDASGQAGRVVAVIIDITERKAAEDELQRAHNELEVRVGRRTRELALALERVSAEVEQRRQAEAGRAELIKRIVNTQEDERGRIARELHDNLGQHLTAVMLGLQALETQMESFTGGRRGDSAPRLDKLRELVDGLMRAAHRQAWELRPAELDAMGLESALGQYSRDWSGRTGIEVDFQATNWDKRPAPEVETTLYRVVQEALTNVARHADATLVSVVIERSDTSASVIIEDDGQGFDTEQSTGRLGVLGMQERLSIVNGTLDIESIPGEGTTVFARVPV